MLRRAALSLPFLALLLAGCGGSGGGGGVRAVTVGPANSRIQPEGFQIFTATLSGGREGVSWCVVEPNGGTIDSGGRYQAPTRSGTYTVKATLRGDSSKSGTTSVIVDSGYIVTGTAPATVGFGRTVKLTAGVTGAPSQAVTWSASAGTIDQQGNFTAPTTGTQVTVTATSVSDPGKSKTFTIALAAPLEIVAPEAGTLALPLSRITFSAKVDGESVGGGAGAVDWSADGGTIDANGKFVAPATPGTFTITATRKDDPSVRATATVETVSQLDAVLQVAGKGTIVFELAVAEAPNTTANFVSLINESFYDGIVFHRYEENFVIQGGDPLTKTLPLDDPKIGTGGPGYTIPFEENSLKNVRGSLAMARSQSRDSGGSQWYVNLVDNDSLDGNYVVFGRVKEGLDVVDALRRGDVMTSIRVRKPQ